MDAKTEAADRYSQVDSELRDLNRWMYHHPETAFQEKQASAKLAKVLRRSGFDVEYPAYGLETAFAARAGSSGPEVVICAEYDALPGVGQACGHNIIATAAVGAGHALSPIVEQLGLQLTILGTPAEELYGGKVDLINAGAFNGVAAAMMIHPAPMDVVDPLVIAVVHWDVHYRGVEAHASAYPQLGVNALDAFVQAYVNISTLRQQLYSTDKVHGIITKGGEAANIIPGHTQSTWYVRAPDRSRLEQVMAKVRACFEGAGTATGCSVEIEQVGHPYDNLVSNPLLTELYRVNSAALGRPMLRGSDIPPEVTGSTDMGNVSHLVPAIHPMIGINSLPAVNHQPEFAAHTITPEGERAIADGALGMAWTIIDLAEGNRWSELARGA